MCIIAYVPKGATLDDSQIESLFRHNPDGAGVMWKPAYNAKVEIRKGFMTVNELLDVWHTLPRNTERALHCRIATSGRVQPECCHPFPVRNTVNSMKKLIDSAPAVFMHNGVVSYCNPALGMRADYSDTMVFGAKYLYPLQKALDTKALKKLVENSTPSRFLIFRKGRPAIMLGKWFRGDNGIWYSNDGFKRYAYLESAYHERLQGARQARKPRVVSQPSVFRLQADGTYGCPAVIGSDPYDESYDGYVNGFYGYGNSGCADYGYDEYDEEHYDE